MTSKKHSCLLVPTKFVGIMRYSPLFYGWYSTKTKRERGYEVPLAFFLAMMTVYILSFLIILRKMTKNNKQSKLTEKVKEPTGI